MYWGYVYPGKGVETLLRAFHAVARDVPNARLALVGGYLDVPFGRIKSKDYYRMVRALPEKLGISDRVIWTGGFDWDSEAGSQYLFAGDACVLPLDWGITLNNSSLAAATTHGLPVIGTEVPGRPDEVLEHGQNVYLCPPSNPAALADAMTQLIRDEAFRERLRRGSCALAEAWHSWPTMTERLVEILTAARAEGGKSAERPSKPLPVTDSGSAAAVGGQQGQVAFYPTDPPTPRFGARDLPCHPARNGRVAPKGDEAPLVSVVVAVYNVEKYLSQCLDALVNQTLKNIEIIVVNDASTDNSQRIINEYSARYPSIRVITCTVNQGLATVRNIGMRQARGCLRHLCRWR